MNGPDTLHTDLLTRNEMGAMLEHIFYRAKGEMRAMLAQRMPDAYQRLTGQSDGSMACLLSSHIKAQRTAGRAHVAVDVTLHNGHNAAPLARYTADFDGLPAVNGSD